MSAFVPSAGAPLRSANSFVGAAQPAPSSLCAAPRPARAARVTMADEEPKKKGGLSLPKVGLPKVGLPKVSLPSLGKKKDAAPAAPAPAAKANVQVKAASGAASAAVASAAGVTKELARSAPTLGSGARAPTNVRSFPKEYQFLADRKILNGTTYDMRIVAPQYSYTENKVGSKNVTFNDLDVYTDDAFWEHPNGWPREQVLAAIDRVLKQLFGTSKLTKSDLRSIKPLVMCFKQTGNVQEFVRQIALSDLYKTRFFEPVSNLRFIELNFKHFLGRAPRDQAELCEHVDIVTRQGYDAEINSYIDSEEYNTLYGYTRIPAVNFESRFPYNQNMNRTAVLNGAYATPDTLSKAAYIIQADQAAFPSFSIAKGLPSGWKSEKKVRTEAFEAAQAEVSPLADDSPYVRGAEEVAYQMKYGIRQKFWYGVSEMKATMFEPVLEHSPEEEAAAAATLKYGSSVSKLYSYVAPAEPEPVAAEPEPVAAE